MSDVKPWNNMEVSRIGVATIAEWSIIKKNNNGKRNILIYRVNKNT